MSDYKNKFTRNTVPFSPPLDSGKGEFVWDVDGREYIDCCAQTLNMNLGQCHPDVTEAVVAQARKLTYASSRFASDPAVKLVEKLVQITPRSLTKVNIKNTSGSSANECAIKSARKKSGRDIIVSVMESHLGQTFEMMKVSGKHFEASFIKERNTRFLPAPYCFRCPHNKTPDSCDIECLRPLEEIWKADGPDIGALITEAIMVDAGVLVPPHAYHRRLREFCTANDVALIYDEVQTGFGWLGYMFAMDYYEVTPDIVTFGKGMSGGFPIAATVLSEQYDVLTYGEHEITYGAHPVSCAASLATINYVADKGGLREAAEKGEYALARLRDLAARYKVIGDVRGVGLIIGIEIVDPKDNSPDERTARRIFEEMLEKGVILRLSTVGKHSSVLQFKPPIIIERASLDKVFDRFEEVLKSLQA